MPEGDLEGQVDREQVELGHRRHGGPPMAQSGPWSTARQACRPGTAVISLEGLLLASSVRVGGGSLLCGAAFVQVIADRQGRRKALWCSGVMVEGWLVNAPGVVPPASCSELEPSRAHDRARWSPVAEKCVGSVGTARCHPRSSRWRRTPWSPRRRGGSSRVAVGRGPGRHWPARAAPGRRGGRGSGRG